MDHTKEDDETPMYVYLTKKAICEQIAEPVHFYIQLREVLEDLSLGIPLDFEDKYAKRLQRQIRKLPTGYCGKVQS